jgi:hypothetical protein
MESLESEYLVAIHEFVEAILCRNSFISTEDVDNWDMDHPELDEPGADVGAPYHDQHMTAEFVERVVCQALGLSWLEHCENVRRASDPTEQG